MAIKAANIMKRKNGGKGKKAANNNLLDWIGGRRKGNKKMAGKSTKAHDTDKEENDDEE